MTYREMAIDAGARSDDEIRQLAEEAERIHRAETDLELAERNEPDFSHEPEPTDDDAPYSDDAEEV